MAYAYGATLIQFAKLQRIQERFAKRVIVDATGFGGDLLLPLLLQSLHNAGWDL